MMMKKVNATKATTKTIHPLDVLLYNRLYAAFLGLVNQPMPRGALKPRLCLNTLLKDVLAAILLFKDGLLYPNFIGK